MPDRGQVWLADLDPRRGTEPGKTRPVLIVQSRALMQAEHPSTIIVPLTSQLTDGGEPLRLRFRRRGRLRQDSDLLIDQLRAIDNRRLVGRPLCRAPQPLMLRVGLAIREVLDLVD
jgi:mRNA interferase MazF